ncbi:MAG: hypothetical protein DMG27_20380 [Acidobacteria bacterium]|nr:MAG: hypothetical protein DMG27_20380 [Acidobacteriota bacterium]
MPEYTNYDILDQHRQAGLLSREYRRLGLHQLGDQHWRPIHDFRRNADALENELIDLKKLKGTPFGRVYEDYCRMSRRYQERLSRNRD